MRSVDKYLERIGFNGRFEASLETLQQLHLAQLRAIPYENIDVRLGKLVSLELNDIYNKIVTGGRGGYCYELNSLFVWVLEQAGFEVRYVSARIISIYGDGNPGPEFEHMVLLVRAGDNWWLADVGHGEVFDMPMPLVAGIEQAEATCDVMLSRAGETWFVSRRDITTKNQWKTMYQFSLTPRKKRDFYKKHEWNLQSHSAVYKNITLVLKNTSDGSLILANECLKKWVGRERTEMIIPKEGYLDLLENDFGITLPEDTPVDRLLAPDQYKGTRYGYEEAILL